jgi:hypothetical protein
MAFVLQLLLTKYGGIPAIWIGIVLFGLVCVMLVNSDAAKQQKKREGLLEEQTRQNDARREAMRQAFKNVPIPAKPAVRNRKATREERKYLGGGGYPRMSSGEVALAAMKEQQSNSCKPLWAAAGPGMDSSSNTVLKAKEERAQRTLLSESERALSEADAHAARALQASYDRELVKDQDSSYEESLRADQEKKRKNAEEERKNQEAEDRLHEEEKAALLLAQEREKARLELSEEPEVDAKGLIELAFRLPNGSRLNRRFLLTDTMQLVFTFLRCSQEVRLILIDPIFTVSV